MTFAASSTTCRITSVSYTHLDVYKRQVEDNTYIVEGKWLERLMSNVNFGDYESRMFFDKMLRENGVFQQLEDLGIKDGDIVSMYELEFEYQH